jgi:hypothetical protein
MRLRKSVAVREMKINNKERKKVKKWNTGMENKRIS